MRHTPPHAPEQYFTVDPASPDVRRTLSLTLRGHDVQVQTSNGVFSTHRLDLGTSVLLRQAPPPPPSGDLLDLGCGWGPLAMALAMESPQATVWAVDTNTRALELTRHNAQANDLTTIRAAQPDSMDDGRRFACIWSNPPIRIGKEALHALLLHWLPRLTAPGCAYLVVQRNLGADSLMTWLDSALGDGFEVSKYASSKGYRLIEVLRTP